MMRRTLAALGVVLLTLPAQAEGQATAPDLGEAIAAYKAGELNDAIRDFRAILEAKPIAMAALFLGSARLKQGKLGDAIEAFEQAIRLEKNDAKRKGIEELLEKVNKRNAGVLVITTNPPGAEVRINDSDETSGTTPLEIKLTSGEHTVRLSLDGFDQEEKKLDLKFGAKTPLDVELKEKPCSVTFEVSPAGASLSVDGKKIEAPDETQEFASGDHKYVVELENHVKSEKDFSCARASTQTIAERLSPLPGRVQLSSLHGAQLLIDGAPFNGDISSPIELAVGQHELQVTQSRREPWTKALNIEPNQDYPIEVPRLEYARGPNIMGYRAYAGAAVGWTSMLNKWDLGANAFESQDGQTQFAADSFLTGGILGGFALFNTIHLEGELRYIGLPNSIDTGFGLSYGASLGYSFTQFSTIVVPHIQLGGGVNHALSGSLGNDIDPRGHLGLGTRVLLSERIRLRADVRAGLTDGFDLGVNLDALLGAEVGF